MQKTTQYKELIQQASDYYKSNPPECQNIPIKDQTMTLNWCPGLENQINLWTYWQGNGNLDTAEILVVGKDFGNCEKDGKLVPFYHDCINSDANDAEKISNQYIKEILANKNNTTDNNLIELFSILSQSSDSDYEADKPNPRLFFTNLCLGYRDKDKLTGGDLTKIYNHDVQYLSKLISIIEPKLVILLGQDVSLSVFEALGNTSEPTARHLIKMIKDNFNEVLDSGKNYLNIKYKENSVRAYAVSHAGHFGSRVNRNGGFERVKEDWRLIGLAMDKVIL